MGFVDVFDSSYLVLLVHILSCFQRFISSFPLVQDPEQVVTHQPAISFSISPQFSFNRAGGRTSNVLPKMRLTQLLLTLLIITLFTGCGEPKADISTPKTHRSGAITLDYPKNWKITEESITSEIHSFFIETNGDALVIFQSYPSEDADDLPVFSKSFSDAATETPIGKIADATFTEVPDEDGYKRIMESFTITLLGESIPHQRLYGSKDIGDKRIYLIFQVASEDFAKVASGFQLIRKSLRGNQTAEDAPSNGG